MTTEPDWPSTHGPGPSFSLENGLIRGLSLFTCLLTVAGCLAASGWVTHDRRLFVQIFADFHLKLWALTQFIVDIPDIAIWIGGAFLAGAAVLTQCLARHKRTAIAVHMAIVAVTCVAVLIYREAMIQTFIDMLFQMTGTAGSGGRP